MPDEIIGSLGVEITGDTSGLDQAIQDATSAATSGAETIVSAFQSVASQTDLTGGSLQLFQGILAADEAAGRDLTQTLTEVAASASTVGDAVAEAAQKLLDQQQAASGAAQALTDVGTAGTEASGGIESSGAAATEAETGLSGMVEQLTLLGEALVITEGLKEFGQEALTAYGTVQSVTIGLTALTKSATDADEIVGQIKELAATEPFAFPEIAPTVQKMVALGVSTEQVAGVMQAAADASAATGNGFGQVANMIDRMSLSGTANTRAMATLGISMGDLGAAMGVTADEAKQTFAALDQTDRITALEGALSKFAGTAIAEAQGIAGQWQIFQNSFEEVMVGVGGALAPVVGDILSFGKAVLSGVQTAVEVFGELPAPVQDVVVAVGLLAAAVVPLTAGIAAVGLGVIGLNGIIPALTGLTSALGITSTSTAEGIAAEGVAATVTAGELGSLSAASIIATGSAVAGSAALGSEGMAGAASEATAAAGELAGGLGLGAGVAGAVALVVSTWGTWKLAEWASSDALAGIGALQQIEQAASNVAGAVSNLAGKVNTELTGALQANAAAAKIWVDALVSLGLAIPGVSTAVDKLQGGMDALNLVGFNASVTLGKLTPAEQEYDKALLKTMDSAANNALAQSALQDKLEKLHGALDTANNDLAQAKLGLDGSQEGAELYAAAQAEVTKATNALNSALGEHATKTDAAQKALDRYAKSADATKDVMQTFAQQVQAGADAIENAQAKEDAQMQVAVGVWLQLATSAISSSASVEAAYAKVQEAVKKTGDDYDALGLAITGAMSAQGLTLTSLIQNWADLASSGEASAADIKSAWQLVQVAATATGVSTQQLVDKVNALTADVPGMGAVIENGQLKLVGFSAAVAAAATGVTELRGAAVPSTLAVQTLGDAAGKSGDSIKSAYTEATTGTGVIQKFGYTYLDAAGNVETFTKAQIAAGLGAQATGSQFVYNDGILKGMAIQYGAAASSVDALGTKSTSVARTLQTDGESVYQSYLQATTGVQQLTTQGFDPLTGKVQDVTVGIQGLTGAQRDYAQGVDTATSSTQSLTTEGYDPLKGTTEDVTISVQGLGDQIDTSATDATNAVGPLTQLADGYTAAGAAAGAAASNVDLFNQDATTTLAKSGGKGGSNLTFQIADSVATLEAQGMSPAAAAGYQAQEETWNAMRHLSMSGASSHIIKPSRNKSSPSSRQLRRRSNPDSGHNPGSDRGGAQQRRPLPLRPPRPPRPGFALRSLLATLLQALEATGKGVNAVTYALTGGSLVPALDSTLVSVVGLERGVSGLGTIVGGSIQTSTGTFRGGDTLNLTTAVPVEHDALSERQQTRQPRRWDPWMADYQPAQMSATLDLTAARSRSTPEIRSRTPARATAPRAERGNRRTESNSGNTQPALNAAQAAQAVTT